MNKRKFEETENHQGTSNTSEKSNGDINGETSEKKIMSLQSALKNGKRKKCKNSVHFNDVDIYYFERKQGFACVPSQGGSTLGMESSHMSCDKFTVTSYAKHQRKVHRLILSEQRRQGKLLPVSTFSPYSSQDEDEEGEQCGDEEEEDQDDEVDEYYFLQPINTRQRRVLLRQSGVKKIVAQEKDECRAIRASREICGCDCRGRCVPDSCSCALAGVQCQVDRLSFPCGCTKDGCRNAAGRVEFNPIRVRSHYIHTVMRLEMERKYERVSGDEAGSSGGGGGVEAGARVVLTADDDPLRASAEPALLCTTVPGSELDYYNSNEQGSCRDCQQSNISEALMREPSFAADFAKPPAPDEAPPTQLTNHCQFSSGDDYTAENTTDMIEFPKEESDYSESSEETVEASDECLTSQQNASGSGTSYMNSNFNNCNTTMNKDCFNQPTNNAMQQQHLNYVSLDSKLAEASPQLADVPLLKLEPISELLNPIGENYSNFILPTATSTESTCLGNFNGFSLTSDQCNSHVPVGEYVLGQQSERSNIGLLNTSTDCSHSTLHSSQQNDHSTLHSLQQSDAGRPTLVKQAAVAEFDYRQSSTLNSSYAIGQTNGVQVPSEVINSESHISNSSTKLDKNVSCEQTLFSSQNCLIYESLESPSNSQCMEQRVMLNGVLNGINSENANSAAVYLDEASIGKFSTNSDYKQEQDVTDVDCSASQSHNVNSAKNFGEIIKESIVETVSA